MDFKLPKITVTVPLYNTEKYCVRCINSILNQTYTNFELLLIDDGSSDQCGKICDEFANIDSRIHVFHQKNSGLSAARNAGLDWTYTCSDFEWLTFIDSDDWVLKNYLEQLYNCAIKLKKSISTCDFFLTDGMEPTVDDKHVSYEELDTVDYYKKHMINATIACAKLYKSECFKSIRFPVGRLHEDAFTTYKVLFKSPSICRINNPMYFYYKNPDGIMHSEWNEKRVVDTLDALLQRLAFFRNRGYLDLEIIHLFEFFELLENKEDVLGSSIKKHYRSIVRKELIIHCTCFSFKDFIKRYISSYCFAHRLIHDLPFKTKIHHRV